MDEKTFYKMLKDVEKKAFMELTCHAMGDPRLYIFSHSGMCLFHNKGGKEKDCSL